MFLAGLLLTSLANWTQIDANQLGLFVMHLLLQRLPSLIEHVSSSVITAWLVVVGSDLDCIGH